MEITQNTTNNCKVELQLNPNKAGLFEGSFSWGGGGGGGVGVIFKKNLSHFSKTLYDCETIYLKYVESEKLLTSSIIS